MNINEFNEIYLSYLKRNPTINDIKAHLKKSKNDFLIEIFNCKEYTSKVSVIGPNMDMLNRINLDMKFGSGYGNIFMHNSHLHYVSPNNVYDEIALTCPSYYDNKWHSILALTSNDNRVIVNSNTFYWERWQEMAKMYVAQNSHCRIYDRLIYTYHHIKNSQVSARKYINEECFLMANPFTCANSGHELSIILDAVNYLRKVSVAKIVVFGYAHKYPNNLNLLKLLVPEEKLLFIEFNVLYQFKKIHIIKQELHNICKHPQLIEELKSKILARYSGDITKFKGKKIVMIKSTRNIQVSRGTDQFICENLFMGLHKRGYLNINPNNITYMIWQCILCMRS